MSPSSKSELASLKVNVIVAVSPAFKVALSLLTAIVGATVSTAVPEDMPLAAVIALPAKSRAPETSTVTSAKFTLASTTV